MTEVFSSYDYLRYLSTQWRVPVSAAIVALVLSLGVSLVLPKRYTALSSVIIDLPGGSDPRLSIGVSAVYLESLKSYERLASGDSLFAAMVEKFQLQKPGSIEPIESLKRRILQVGKIRDTRVLEIRVTLADPIVAQQCAQYIAEETVKLSHAENVAADREVTDNLNRQLQEARERLAAANKSQMTALAGVQTETLQGVSEVDLDALTRSQQALNSAVADVAELQQRTKPQPASAALPTDDMETLVADLRAAKARVESLRAQIAELKEEYTRTSGLLAEHTARNQQIQSELESAQTAYTAALTHWNDHNVEGGSRGERLRLIDPGIVPQRPSYPNIPVNVGAALLISVLVSCVYTALGFAKRLHMGAPALRESFSVGS